MRLAGRVIGFLEHGPVDRARGTARPQPIPGACRREPDPPNVAPLLTLLATVTWKPSALGVIFPILPAMLRAVAHQATHC